MSLKVFDGEAIAVAMTAEWIAEEDQWTVRGLDPLGQVMLSVLRQGNSLKASGLRSDQLSRLSLDADNFFTIDDHFIGVKAQEVPCLLYGAIPATWRPALKAVEEDGLKTRLWFDDDRRVIKVTTVKSASGSRPDRFCSQIKWGSWLWRQKVVVCLDLENDQVTTAKGIGPYQLEWTPL